MAIFDLLKSAKIYFTWNQECQEICWISTLWNIQSQKSQLGCPGLYNFIMHIFIRTTIYASDTISKYYYSSVAKWNFSKVLLKAHYLCFREQVSSLKLSILKHAFSLDHYILFVLKFSLSFFKCLTDKLDSNLGFFSKSSLARAGVNLQRCF